MSDQDSTCIADEDYNFRHCVYKWMAKEIGCKLPWYTQNMKEYQTCLSPQDYRKYELLNLKISDAYMDDLEYETGCYKPCTYRDFRIEDEQKN